MTISDDMLIKKLKEMNYFLIKYYMKKNYKMVIIKDSEGYFYNTSFDNLSRNHFPRFVDKSNPYSLENISLWLIKNKKDFVLCNENIYDGEYKKLKFYHKKCDDYFYMNWRDVFNQGGCSVCSGMQVGNKHSLFYKRPDLMNEWNSINKINPCSIGVGYSKKVYWICSKCGHEWMATVDNRVRVNSGCPMCASSKGEDSIKKSLDRNNFNYIYRYPILNCRDVLPLPFDFYLPNYNTCIEYQGIQHYEPTDFGNKGKKWAEKEFKVIKKHDRIKKKYCKENNIKLIIIPYWDYDNIDDILKRLLNVG